MIEVMTKKGKSRCGLFLGLSLLLVVMVLALVLGPWWLQWRNYQDAAVGLAERVVRYQRLLDGRSDLESQLARFRKELMMRGYFIEAGSAELAAAELQQFIKEAVEKAEGTLVSTQNIPTEEGGELQRIEIKVRMKGDVESLARVLHVLEGSNPVVTVEDLSVRSRRTIKGRKKSRVEGYSLDVNFKVVGYLLKKVAA